MAELAGHRADAAPLAGAAEGLAFEAWYQAEWARVLSVVGVFVADRQAAEDVAAEAFARALGRWGRVGAMASPTGWVIRVAVNLARRRGRRLALEQRLLGAKDRQAPEADRDHMAAETWDAVRSLPPRQRLAIALRYIDDLPEHQIAEVMGVSPGTVAATLHAARQRLAQSWSTT